VKAVAERNSSIVLVQIDPDPSGETPFDQTRGVIVDTRRRTVSEPAYVQSILSRGYWTPFKGDEDEVVGIVASITAAAFVEADHPRHPKGSEAGGEFRRKDDTSAPSGEDEERGHKRPAWLKGPADDDASAGYYKALRPREAISDARGWLTENGVTEMHGIPLEDLNAVGVVEAMNQHFPDGYEAFLAIELDAHKEAFHHNFAPNGEYTPERREFHAATRAFFIGEGHQPPAGEKPMALFMAGGTASGKSSIVGKPKMDGSGEFKEGLLDVGEGNVLVNPDEIKPLSDEAQDLIKSNDWRWAMLSHEESSYIAASIKKDAEEAGFPIVVDGTGDAQGPSERYPEGKFMDKVRAAEAAGYRTKIVMVDIPTDEAIKRAKKRTEDEAKEYGGAGRKVSESAIRSLHKNVTQRHLEWRDMASDWEVWANDDDAQGGRRMIAHRVAGGPIEILDRKRYAQMEAKANE